MQKVNGKWWCDHHETLHTDEIVEKFRKKAESQSLFVSRTDCPIRVILEDQSDPMLAVQAEYSLVNKPCAKAQWPDGIDLLITRLPTTGKEGYSKGLAGVVANKAHAYMRNNALAFVVVSSYKEDKTRPFEVASTFKDAGFNFVDTIIWVKNKFTPTQGGKRLNNVYDYIFMFSKGDGYYLNRESVHYLRKIPVEISEEYADEEGLGEIYCPGNVWQAQVDEKDSLSTELVESVTKLANIVPKSVVVDPFMDNGAVLQVCIENSYSFWGCESDKTKFKRCQKILKKKGKK